MGEKGNPLDFLGELPVNMLAQLPDLAVAYRQWRETQEAEAAAEAAQIAAEGAEAAAQAAETVTQAEPPAVTQAEPPTAPQAEPPAEPPPPLP